MRLKTRLVKDPYRVKIMPPVQLVVMTFLDGSSLVRLRSKRKKTFEGTGLAVTRCCFFFGVLERQNLPCDMPKTRYGGGKRAIRTLKIEGNPSFGGSLPDLFFLTQNRYHPIREVATHKEPGKDKGRAQHRGTMAMRETAAGRRPVQRSR